jgi:hypothetical protein
MNKILWGIVVLLFVGWILGFLVFKILGGIIHILLVLAIVLIIYNWFSGIKEKG